MAEHPPRDEKDAGENKPPPDNGKVNETTQARLTATASDHKLLWVMAGYLPVVRNLTRRKKVRESAVFINSTPGRHTTHVSMQDAHWSFPQFTIPQPHRQHPESPTYNDDPHPSRSLSDCWERTKDMEVPQFRDGECEVRRLWDEAVAEAMGWDAAELSHLRELLHQEPHVRGLGYGQYGDEVAEGQEWELSPTQ